MLQAMPLAVRPRVGGCEVAVALLWALVVIRAGVGDHPWGWAALLLVMAWWAVLLSVCDLVAYRLPDGLTLPAYPIVALAVVIAAHTLERPGIVGGAIAGSALYAGTYATVRLCSPSSLGPGDLKLAGALGACSGAISPWATVVCMLLASVLTLFMALWRRHGVPHGPAMLGPVWGLLLLS